MDNVSEIANITDEIMEDSELVDKYERFGKNWQEVVNAILIALVSEDAFLYRVVKDFANNDWATSLSAKKVMISLRAGLAVYGKLTESKVGSTGQKELALKILRDHTNILFCVYGTEFGVEEDSKMPF